MRAITDKQAIKRIQAAIEDVSAEPDNLSSATNEACFLIEVYELLVKYGYDF